MKKILTLILAFCALLSLVACNNGETAPKITDSVSAWAFHSYEKTVVNSAPEGEFSTEYTVYLAKGETEGCQVALYSKSKLENTTLTEKSGDDAIEVSVYSMNHSHKIGKRQYTDSLIPCKGDKITLEEKTVLPFMIEFKTDENTPSGDYEYVYEFKNESGKVLATFNITVHVWDIVLPKEKTFATSANIGTEWIAYHGVYTSEIYAMWYEMVLEHNISGYYVPYGILDDRADAYMSDPRVTSFMVKIPTDTDGNIIEEDLLKVYNKLKSNPDWLKKAYFLPLDEPRTPDHLTKLREWEKKLSELCPEIEIMAPYYTNIQLGEGRDQTDDMIEYTDLWCPKLCLWDDKMSYDKFLNYKPEKSFADRIAEQKAKGDRVWSYVCNSPDDPYAQMFIDTEGVNQRLLFWQMYQRDIEGFLYWSVNYYGYKEGPGEKVTATPLNPWETTNTKITNGEGKTIYGCGFLFYPGKYVRAGFAVPSIRAKIVRDGIDDIELFYLAEKYLDREWLMEKAKAGTPSLTEYVNGDKFASLRIEIGNALETAIKK